ncbi:MAG: hypothetical protein IJ498_05155 [Akkermansia sp.]|nr:hypothetical protein [Akkermansia sp.]
MRKKTGGALPGALRSCWVLPAVTAAGWLLYVPAAWALSYVSLNEGAAMPLWLSIIMSSWSALMVSTLLLGPLWLIVMTVLWIRRRQWGRLVWGWVCSAGTAGVFVLTGLLLMVLAIAGPGDNFAEGLRLPQDVEFVYPRNLTFFDNEEYAERVAPLRVAAPQLPPLTEQGDASAPNLMKLSRENPELLQEYMMRCLYAEAVNPRFTAYVLQEDVLPVHDHDPQAYFRSTLMDERCSYGDDVSVMLGDCPEAQWCLPLENGWSIAIRKPDYARPGEQADVDCSAAVARLDASLAGLAGNPTREYLDSILPALPDTPFVCLWDDGAGSYEMLMVIPADFEEGRFELRAHEYTTGKNIQFAQSFLPEKKLGRVCRVICSDRWNTVYSGEWSEYYGSVWEIWFTPASGGEPRRVSSQNFLMMGWSH